MYLKSSEIVKIGEKNYLRIFLEKEYPYLVKFSSKEMDQEFEILEMLFEEPTSLDINDLRKLAVSLEKLASYDIVKSIRIANLFSREALEELREIQIENPEQQNKEKTTEDKIEASKSFLASIFEKSKDFEDESTDYFSELDKFFSFLNKKCGREHDGIVLKNSINVIDKYNAISCFIKEEILIEYLSFFFDHLPSKSLHMSLKQ